MHLCNERPDRNGNDFLGEILAYENDLFCAARRWTRSEADAEDIVQEALIRAWRFRARFEPGTNSRAWMQRILFNTFVNRYRKRRREREIVSMLARAPSCDVQLQAEATSEELDDQLRAAFDDLAPDFQKVVRLVDLEERSYRDAAREMSCPVGTVMSRLHRARKAMKRSLEAQRPATQSKAA